MMTAKQAVQSAVEKLYDLLGTSELSEVPSQDVTLEEVEFDNRPESKLWKVTVAYPIPALEMNQAAKVDDVVAQALGRRRHRKYKVIAVDAETGDLVSMKVP